MQTVASLLILVLSGCSVISVARAKNEPGRPACPSGVAQGTDLIVGVLATALTVVSLGAGGSGGVSSVGAASGAAAGAIVFAPIALTYSGSFIYGVTRDCDDEAHSNASPPNRATPTAHGSPAELAKICRDYELATGRPCQ